MKPQSHINTLSVAMLCRCHRTKDVAKLVTVPLELQVAVATRPHFVFSVRVCMHLWVAHGATPTIRGYDHPSGPPH